MAVNIGPKIGIDGEAEYRKQIQGIIQETKTLDSQMKNLKSSFDKEGASIKQNREYKQLLTEKIEAQSRRVEELNSMLEQSAQKYGESDTKTLKWKQAVEDATAELNNMNKELEEMPSDLEIVGNKFEAVGGKISSVGDTMTKFVTGPIAAIGAASVASFKEMDEAMDTIVTKTGATGEALTDMQDRAKEMAETIPVSFQSAADAVGEVNTRFGLMGDELQEVSTAFVQFAEINGTDVSTSIDSVQSAMAAFGISAQDATLYLDTLNKAGQDTGVSVDQLASDLATNAAGLKEMGYSASDSAMLLANLSKNGVDSASAMTGLKKAYAESLKTGVSMNDMLSDLESRLQNSDTQADAAAEALELFGTRAGGSLVEALESGRMSFEAMGTSMSDFAGNVSSTYEGTLDPLDQMTTVMNQLKDIGADLVVTAGPMLTKMMQTLSDVVGKLADAWNGLDEGQQESIVKFALLAAAVGPVLSIVGRITTGIGGLMTTFSTLTPMISTLASGAAAAIPAIAGFVAPFLPFIAIGAAVVAAGVLIYKNWDTIKEKAGQLKDAVTTKWDEIKTATSEKWEAVKSKTSEVMSAVKEASAQRMSEIKQAFEDNGGGIKGAVAAAWEGIKGNYRMGFNAINTLTNGKLGEIAGAFRNKFTELKNNALNWGRDMISNLIEGIRQMIDKVKNAAEDVAKAIADRLHFSEPDEGPLSNFHTYMPDMMDMLSKGMLDNLGKVEMAANEVAGAIAGATSNSYNYGGFTIVVNGAEGQNMNELADIIEDRINSKIASQKAVWA